MRRQDVTSSVSPAGPPPGPSGAAGPTAKATASPAEHPSDALAQPPETPTDPPGVVVPAAASVPRWLVVLALSTGPAAVYALASLAHAAFVERILSVDVGFGRSLAFWIGAIYAALLTWGFLPRRPRGWYADRRAVLAMLALGLAGAVVCSAFTALWLRAHWVPNVGVPVTASIVVLCVAAVGVLWLAGREDRTSPPS